MCILRSDTIEVTGYIKRLKSDRAEEKQNFAVRQNKKQKRIQRAKYGSKRANELASERMEYGVLIINFCSRLQLLSS